MELYLYVVIGICSLIIVGTISYNTGFKKGRKLGWYEGLYQAVMYDEDGGKDDALHHK